MKIVATLWNKLSDLAGRLFGTAETATHGPLFPILRPYMCRVTDELWRGSWPSDTDLFVLQANGIKRVINLCAERQQDYLVLMKGMIPNNLYVTDGTTPTYEQAEQFLILIEGECCYVHCEEGIGRTGCIVAYFRVKKQLWTPQRALAEAESFGPLLPDQRAWILAIQ